MSKKDKYFFVLSVCAIIIIVLLLYGFPILRIVISSFFSQSNLGGDWFYVGLTNYISSIFDPKLWQSLLASAVFTFLSVSLQITFALLAALVTYRTYRGVETLRWIFLLPYFFSTVVVVIAWNFFTDPIVGLATQFLKSAHLPLVDFRSPSFSLPAMVVVSTYEAFPFCYAVFLARLLQIPKTLYVVAELDRASVWKSFTTITWPQIKLSLLGIVLLRIVITALKFDVPWLVYAYRAESKWSDTFAVWLYRTAFEQLSGGKAFASTLTFLMALGGLIYLFVTLRNIKLNASAAIQQ